MSGAPCGAGVYDRLMPVGTGVDPGSIMPPGM
eukprot:CAMPEP_0194554636 /NCGR_PEP_ID=MMETSP0253-20130528/97840_1 /TAXON_ID=2966 /ORGANISM="Noctiluca scintillans" /LENGTH=31 /DNA_ID= /DNA_START= /DNA_END= /DNA_ORIENTATION=